MVTQLLSENLVQAIAGTLLHSTWQITLIAIMLLLLLKLMKKSSSAERYAISFGALIITTLVTIITFSIYFINGGDDATQVQHLSTTHLITAPTTVEPTSLAMLWNDFSPWIVSFWLIGTLAFAMKLIGGYVFITSIIKRYELEDSRILNKLEQLKEKLDIKRDIACFVSDNISSPMVMGAIKPIILFPVGLVNQLTIDEVEAILSHELAHIKRHDFLANVLQSILESIFYFHPAIWFISRAVRQERELCCDDIAIEQIGNSMSYAKTLIKLQEMRIQHFEPALGMAGSSGQFSDRIKRILDVPSQSQGFKGRLIPLLLVCFGLFGFIDGQEIPVEENKVEVYIIDDCPQDMEEIKKYLDTIPENNDFHIKKRKDSKDIELHMEDGEITSMKIDGKEIPKEDYEKHKDIIVDLSPESSENIITVFPDCGEGFGNIFLLDKEREVFKMDSILKNFDTKLRTFEDFEEGKFGFHVDRFNSKMIDSLLEEANGISFSQIKGLNNDLQFDSIFDLLPEVSELIDTLRMGSYKWKKDALGNGRTIWKDGRLKEMETTKGIRKYKTLDSNPYAAKVSDVLAGELLEDQLVDDSSVSKVVLTGKQLKINGEKQPSNIWKKYKKLYEQHTGITLTKDSKVRINVDPKSFDEKVVYPTRISI